MTNYSKPFLIAALFSISLFSYSQEDAKNIAEKITDQRNNPSFVKFKETSKYKKCIRTDTTKKSRVC